MRNDKINVTTNDNFFWCVNDEEKIKGFNDSQMEDALKSYYSNCNDDISDNMKAIEMVSEFATLINYTKQEHRGLFSEE